MPELPEVEVLVRHLRPLIRNKTIRGVRVLRDRVLGATPSVKLRRTLLGKRFVSVSRRGKYLCFQLRTPRDRRPVKLIGHLGMTGRMYLSRRHAPPAKHAAVILELGRTNFVFEDTRYFGRLTLDDQTVARLGPEPLSEEFSTNYLVAALARSSQAIKVKLLDQRLVAGIGNIYASEALFRAGISPRLPARELNLSQLRRLRRAIREVLREAIRFGSTVPLNHGAAGRDSLFYFGRAADAPDYYEERLRVYDREGRPCVRCGANIRRILQAARSTFYCPRCQSR
ncbi:MAG: bifunctional DNA-formamidopyrimidine glycosylase/DNA-(apurinic or apyrimidinic site) lyase [Verrucomicrobia bacterium]|nr:bifunctional DNA-formamidopyrimidine glycosylase/DNA-(apurinic or apyrimidinic site) lyase [Verrucomicrobiota bacterium]